LRTDLIEQAAHDKHLFMNAGGITHIELKMPEYVQTSNQPRDNILFFSSSIENALPIRFISVQSPSLDECESRYG
jgi:hypothetical protein